MKDFKGELLSQYNTTADLGPSYYMPTAVKIFAEVNMVVYFKRTQLYIFDMTRSELLSCTELHGTPEYGEDLQIRLVRVTSNKNSNKKILRIICR